MIRNLHSFCSRWTFLGGQAAAQTAIANPNATANPDMTSALLMFTLTRRQRINRSPSMAASRVPRYGMDGLGQAQHRR